MPQDKDEYVKNLFQQLQAGDEADGIPGRLADLSNQELLMGLVALKSAPAQTQEMVLLDILRLAEDSEIGRKYNFAKMCSSDDFRRDMPITEYADYAGAVEKMAAGEADILFHGATTRFIATSGTTGIAKLIPESAAGELVKSLVGRIRLLLLLTLAPEIMRPELKILSITNLSEYAKTEGGIPIGSASGQAVKDIPSEMRQKLILPPELLLASDLSNETMDYLILLLALAEEKMAGVVCSNVAHFQLLLDNIADWEEDLLTDIARGSVSPRLGLEPALHEALSARLAPNPERAENLKDILSNYPHGVRGQGIKEIWPNFSVVSCWMAASSARIVEDLQRRLPAPTKFLEWGYGASEGKFNLPGCINDPAGDLALFGYFFEFLPLGQVDAQPLLTHQLETGAYYEMLITSYSGLYRYNMKDIVCVAGHSGASPRIVFAAKTSETLQLGELELFIYEIDEYVRQVSARLGAGVRFYQVMADTTPGLAPDNRGVSAGAGPVNAAQKASPAHLVVYLEASDEDFPGELFSQELEALLVRENAVYRAQRHAGTLATLEVVRLAPGYRDSLFRRGIMPGKNVNQTKLKTIIREHPEAKAIVQRFKGDGR